MRLFFSVSVLFAVVLSVHRPSAQESNTAKHPDTTQQKEQTQSWPTVPPKSYTQTEDSNAQQRKPNNEAPDWFYRTYLISGPIIGILTLATAIVVWKQVVTLRQIERAWVIASLEWASSRGQRVFQEASTTPPSETTYIELKFTLENSGKTPAWIIGSWMRHDVVTKVPDRPSYHGKGEPSAPPETLGAGSKSINEKIILRCPGGLKSEELVVLSVLVEYRDSFEKKENHNRRLHNSRQHTETN